MSLPPMPVRQSKSLRTKNGCVVCRERRKKCDERKPSCATCERLGLKCEFPDIASLEDRRERGAKNSRWSTSTSKAANTRSQSSALVTRTRNVKTILLNSGDVANVKRPSTSTMRVFSLPPYSHEILSTAQIFLRSDREVQISTYYFENFLPENILPDARIKIVRSYAGNEPEVRNAGLACGAMQSANRMGIPPVEALNYYARAVSGLRKKLDAGEIDGSEDWLLVITLLLHCFETWRCDTGPESSTRSQHLLGAIQLLKLRRLHPSFDPHDVFCNLTAESVLFHISTLLASSSSPAILDVDSNLWEWMEIILHKPTTEDASQNPVLGTPWELNKLVFEISKLSVHVQGPLDQLDEKQRLSDTLTLWERHEDEICKHSEHEAADDTYAYIRQLYIVCARILLLWTETAGKDTMTPHVEKQVQIRKQYALDILRSIMDKSDEQWNFMMRWPVLILGHAVDTDAEREIIRKSLEKMWHKSSCGDLKRGMNKMEILWQRDVRGESALGTRRLLGGWSQNQSLPDTELLLD